MQSIQNNVAIVTGGASGLGAALAQELIDLGARVVIADIELERAQATAGILGSNAEAFKVDVTKPREIELLLSHVTSRHGRVDLFINNAGIANFGEAVSIPSNEWQRIVDVNLWGVIHGSLAACRVMKGQGSGKIVNIGSASVFSCDPLLAPYITSKYGVVGFSRVLSLEAESSGIQVSIVCPGNIRTPLLDQREPSWITPAIPVKEAAQRIIKLVYRGRRFIVFPLRWRIVWWLDRFSPSLLNPLRREILRRARKRLSPN